LSNAFTQKPDLSRFIKEVRKTHVSASHGRREAQRAGGKIIPGMGERDLEKTKIHKKV
jgi:hypothetical protein